MGTNFAKFHPTTEVIGCDFKEFPAINPGQMQDIRKLWLMGFICLPTSSSAVNPAICLFSLKLRGKMETTRFLFQERQLTFGEIVIF